MVDDLPPGFEFLQDRNSTTLDRREFLAFVGASLAASACNAAVGTGEANSNSPSRWSGPDKADSPWADSSVVDEIPSDPFQLGVASGDPTPEGVILWTRLVPDPVGEETLPSAEVPVAWEVAEAPPPTGGTVANEFDERAIVRSGTAVADPAWGHSLHVDVSGLRPDSWYTYRFRIGDEWVSRVGQTRTLPAPGARPESFRAVTACCQSYPQGYYTAHRHIAREAELDAVFFLGDYIYEEAFGPVLRPHPNGAPETLEEFRRRYELYKAEPQLREAHRHCPWIVTWDDHEVRNNYAGDEPVRDSLSSREFKEIRAAAYQAYYEHLPLRVPDPSDTDELEIYRRFQVGDLVEFDVLDGRQYRSGIICGGDFGRRCDEATDPEESMLGADQQDWLVENLKSSSTIWHALVQQTILTPINFDNLAINPDMWDGYQSQRQEIIDLLADAAVDNPVVLTGDIHMGMLLDIPRDADDPGDDPIAPEIVTTSITSEEPTGGVAEGLAELAPLLGQIRHFNPSDRGYTLVEFHRDELLVHYRTVSTVQDRPAALRTDASYRIERNSGEVVELER